MQPLVEQILDRIPDQRNVFGNRDLPGVSGDGHSLVPYARQQAADQTLDTIHCEQHQLLIGEYLWMLIDCPTQIRLFRSMASAWLEGQVLENVRTSTYENHYEMDSPAQKDTARSSLA